MCAWTFPTQRVIEGAASLVEWTSRGAWVHPHLAAMPAAQGLARFLGSERAWFALAAIAWGLSIPVAVSALMWLGVQRAGALATVVVAWLAPLGMLAATTPGPAALALLGATCVLLGIAAGEGKSADRAAARASLGWVIGCTLHLGNALLLPAVVAWVGDRQRIGSQRESRWVPWSWVLGAIGALGVGLNLAELAPARAPANDFFAAALQALLGRARRAPTQARQRRAGHRAGPRVRGVRPLGTPAARRQSTALGGVGRLLGRGLAGPRVHLRARRFALAAAPILPMLALGVARVLANMEAERALTRFVLLAGLSVALLAGTWTSLGRTDPDRQWAQRAEQLLEPGDLFLTRDESHLYLARERFEIEALDLREPVELAERYRGAYWRQLAQRVAVAQDAGRRIVLDVGPRGSLVGVRDFPFRRELHRLGVDTPLVKLEHLAAAPATASCTRSRPTSCSRTSSTTTRTWTRSPTSASAGARPGDRLRSADHRRTRGGKRARRARTRTLRAPTAGDGRDPLRSARDRSTGAGPCDLLAQFRVPFLHPCDRSRRHSEPLRAPPCPVATTSSRFSSSVAARSSSVRPASSTIRELRRARPSARRATA